MSDVFATIGQGLALIASCILVWRADPAINRMRRCTPRAISYAFILLVSMALGEIIFIVFMRYIPSVIEVGLLVGTALLLICDRRLRVLTPNRVIPNKPGKV